jgi:sugar phosphate isomerase/epimerase
MKIALSGRLWEHPLGADTTLAEQIQAAAELGFSGMEIRYPRLPQKQDWEEVKQLLERNEIELVFTAGPGVPETDQLKTEFVRVLDTVQFLGGKFLKQIPKDEADPQAIIWAADESAKRGIKLLSQYHSNSATDTVAKTEELFKTINHPNFGLIFDACHIPFTEDPLLSIEEAVTRLRPWIDLVNLQSYKPAKQNDGLNHVTINGTDWSLALPGDPEGTDMAAAINTLKAQGYDGWLVAMPAVDPSAQPLVVGRAYADFLVPFVD